jgi:hypothetical protein
MVDHIHLTTIFNNFPFKINIKAYSLRTHKTCRFGQGFSQTLGI